MPLRLKIFGVTFIILFFFLNTSAQVCHSYEADALDAHMAQQYHHHHKLLSTDSIGLASTDNYDLVYHRFAISLDPAVRYISGSVTSYFKPSSSLVQMAFDLSDSLRVDSVYYHGQRVSNIAHAHNGLTINFATAITALDSVTVFYQGIPPKTGMGSFNLDKHDSIYPVLWTLSEPYGSRDWFPGKMTLTDKVDSTDFYINIPIGNRAACNGLLMDTVQMGGSRVIYHWRHRYPIANYLIGVAVSNYESLAMNVPTQYGNIYMLTYRYAEDSRNWTTADTTVTQALQLYSDLFGPYPFIKEKYGHAQFNWGGGMEHQTMSFIFGNYYELINHEMGHQWFGDKLTCGSWADIWLNEGFATYLSALCYERNAPQYWMPWKQTALVRISRDDGHGSVTCDDTSSVPRIFNSSLTYMKGAYLLHMLRWKLGDAHFFAGIKSYITDTSAIYRYTATALLKHHLEAASGMNLTVFFDQWFYGRGVPSYQLTWAQQDGVVSGRLAQITTDASVPFFTMPVPVKCYGNGRDTIIIIDHTSSGQDFSFTTSFAIDSMHFDPDLWLISIQNTVRHVPLLDRDYFLRLYPNPVSNSLTIWYDSQNIHHLSYSIYDLQGKKVMEDSATMGSDYHQADLCNLERGVYLIKITTEGSSSTQRIVKY